MLSTLSIFWITYLALSVVEEVALVAVVRWQRRRAQQCSEDDGEGVILLPRYRQLLHWVIIQQLIAGLLALWFIQFGKKGLAPQAIMVLSQVLQITFEEGALFVLISRSAGRNALTRSFVGSFLWSLFPALIWGLNDKWPFQRFTNNPPFSELNIVVYIVQASFHLMVIICPVALWPRRPACRTLAPVLLFAQLCAVGLCFSSRDGIDLSTWESVFFGLYLLASLMTPIAAYFAFLQDSRYWSSMVARRLNPGERMPLIPRETAKHLTNVTDEFGSCMLNYAKLFIDFQSYLGSGSSAKVYAGRYKDQVVAVKMLHYDELNSEVITALQDEVASLRRLTHANVVGLTGVCVVPPRIYIVLELCDLGNLRQFLDEHFVECTMLRKLLMAKDCCSAVAFLHSRSPAIIHGDIKSLNFLVASTPTSVVVKIADLELSGYTESKHELPDCPHWLAPELLGNTLMLAKSQVLNAQTDVYALAIVLSEVLTGRMPFTESGSRSNTSHHILRGMRPVLRPIDVPEHLLEAIEEAWDANPIQRTPAARLRQVIARITRGSSTNGLRQSSSVVDIELQRSPSPFGSSDVGSPTMI